jgi:hypothetical protein
MEPILEFKHFIILDKLNTVSGNEFDKSYPYVQIIYPSNPNLDNKGNGSYPENELTYRERRKYFFAITLNVDTGL